MVNLIINIVTTGAWQDLVGIPDRTQAIRMQLRDVLIAWMWRYRGQVAYTTVFAGNSPTLLGEFWHGAIQVNAPAGNVLEAECMTRRVI